jgi:hypothetical protein
VLQKVVEHRAKIGLDDVELALSHGHNFRIIVHDFSARPLLEIGALARTISASAPMVVPDN